MFKPIIKWPGGKTNELPVIQKNKPEKINRYIEPFLGGGSVFFAMDTEDAYINDFSRELMDIYEMVN